LTEYFNQEGKKDEWYRNCEKIVQYKESPRK
jgi:hypothetical protein